MTCQHVFVCFVVFLYVFRCFQVFLWCFQVFLGDLNHSPSHNFRSKKCYCAKNKIRSFGRNITVIVTNYSAIFSLSQSQFSAKNDDENRKHTDRQTDRHIYIPRTDQRLQTYDISLTSLFLFVYRRSNTYILFLFLKNVDYIK